MQRTVLIGLDGATFTVLDAFVAEGVMPFVASFLRGGVRARLMSTPNPLTPPAWTSLVTGRTPGHHGIFDFVRAEDGAGGLYFTLNTANDVRCETLWSLVSRHGGTVAALNFPLSYPPPPIRGYVVPGFVPWKHMRRAVHPPEFYARLKALEGFNVRELSMDMNEELKSIQWLPEDQYEGWITHHIRRERQWLSIARTVLQEGVPDLLAVLFDGVDKLQHLCWRFLDPELTHTTPTPWEASVRDLCRRYFRELDACIAEIVSLAGPAARVVIASDHGFGPTSEVFYANVWLARAGYLSWTDKAVHDETGRNATDRIKSHVVGIDWTRTKAYALTPSSNGIYIRRSRTAGDGGVAEADYEAFRRELATKLSELQHPETGRRFVTRVMTREEAFPGAGAGRAPDLTLVLEDYGFISVLHGPEIFWRRPEPTGTHRPDGVFAAAGPGINARRELDPLALVDVAPILLHSLGLPVPVDLEGRVPDGCFAESHLQAHPIATGPATSPVAAGRDAANGAEDDAQAEAEIMARLRALRYIE